MRRRHRRADTTATRAVTTAGPRCCGAPWVWVGWGWLWRRAVAVAAAAEVAVDGNGGGAGSSTGGGDGGNVPPPVDTTVDGIVLGGPVIDGNGLSVEVFQADGNSQLGQAKVAADGTFSVGVGDYTGVIIARVVDADSGADYLDEASGQKLDLNAALGAVSVVTGSNTTVSINVNPLTTLAAALAERDAGGAPSAGQVNEDNAAVAALFGLSDLHAVAVEPINGASYDASDGLSAAEQYGAILAAFSGADLNNGGDGQKTLDDVLAGLKVSASGVASLTEAAQAVLVQGAQTTDANTGASVSAFVSSLVNTHAPQITSGDTAPAIAENSGAGQVIYTATATDAGTVTWSLQNGGDAAAFTIDTASGAVTLINDPDFETKSSYHFTVVATDEADNRAERTVSLSIENLDESAPTITSGDTAPAIDENSGADQVVYTVTSTDDGDIHTGSTTYGLEQVGDAADFRIDANTGAVTLIPNPDYETQSSYHFTVVATDAAGNHSDQPVTLAINDLHGPAPTVRSVALTGAVGAQGDTLNAGDTVNVTVTMSGDSYVGGTPQIALDIGGTIVHADYVSGSGTSDLVFQYTIVPGENDSDGIGIPHNGLDLNGGTITDATGTDADLHYANVPSDAAFAVDTTAPTLTDSTPAAGASGVGVGDDIVLTFSEDVHAGSGAITLSDGTDSRVIDVTDGSQLSISGNEVTIDPSADLDPGSTYSVQISDGALTDGAGNGYAGIGDNTTLTFDTASATAVDTSVVVFDLVQGSSSDHSERTFDSSVSYDIYIRVDSTTHALSTAGDGPGTWGTWSGADNLGSDDRVILVGDGAAVQGAYAAVDDVSAGTRITWGTSAGVYPAGLVRHASFTRVASGGYERTALVDSPLPHDFLSGQGGQLATMYLTTMPAGILTSQGLA